MRARLRTVVVTAILIFGAMQFIRPSMTKPESDPGLALWSDPDVPSDVTQRLSVVPNE